MVSFPHSKINIGLRIMGKRDDGFHDLESVFYPVAIKDVLEIVNADKFEFTSSGITVDTNKENLCIQAYSLLKLDYPEMPDIKLHLHKAIPIGAGLGGGSSDAAFTLLLLNEKFNLKIKTEKMLAYASILGSDCPFFIKNIPSYITGRGEIIESIPLDLSSYSIAIVNPGIHINTGWAFSQLKKYSQTSGLLKSIDTPVSEWKNTVFNDFELPVFNTYPQIAEIKQKLYDHGALFASMTGTGSTVYGIFKANELPVFSFPVNYFFKWV